MGGMTGRGMGKEDREWDVGGADNGGVDDA